MRDEVTKTLARVASSLALAFATIVFGGCAATQADDDANEDTESSASEVVATRPVKIVHWNISGAVLNKGFNNVVDTLFDEIVARKPDIVSINEGCRDQVEHLRDRLRDKGYGGVSLQFAPTGNNALCAHSFGTNTTQAGPAILVLAGGSNGQNHYWNGNQSVDNRTDRGMACLTANLGKPIRACSLHLATADDAAAKQVESMMSRFGQSFKDAPALLIGDFNASPDYLKANAKSLYAPLGNFHEADSQQNKATHGEGKLDFIFMSKPHFEPSGVVDVKDMGTFDPWWSGRHAYSDHRLVAGEVKLRL